jgi:hypothetical protein
MACISCPTSCFAQDGEMTVGFQLKPIFRNEFFNSGNVSYSENNVSYTVDPRVGFSGGMIIRSDFGKRFSFETGINYVRRNYTLLVSDPDSSFNKSMNFGVVEYEIPLSFLVYVRLADRIYMNNSVGIGFNMFKRSEVDQGEYVKSVFSRSTWIIPGMIANVGCEYRTKFSGNFYIGGSYQLPFAKILTMMVDYDRGNSIESVDYKLSLGYFAFDFKYFFPVNVDN